jgi:hypothetical protein
MADSAPSSTATRKTFHGNCHCGAYKFTAVLPDPFAPPAMICNCSYCTKLNSRWVQYYPQDYTVVKGENVLQNYKAWTETPALFKVSTITVDLRQPGTQSGAVLPNVRNDGAFRGCRWHAPDQCWSYLISLSYAYELMTLHSGPGVAGVRPTFSPDGALRRRGLRACAHCGAIRRTRPKAR